MLLFILWGIGDMHEWKLWNMESLYILPLVGQCKTGLSMRTAVVYLALQGINENILKFYYKIFMKI